MRASIGQELSPAKIKDSQFPALLRFEPCFDRLRGEPHFRELMVAVDQYFAGRAGKK